MKRTKIIGTGAFLPERILTNFNLQKMVDTSDEWIRTRTGIQERRIADKGMAASDLGSEAALRAIDDAGIKAEDIDLIILATFSPDKLIPSTACVVQNKIGAKKAVAFDVAAACSGFVYGISIADQYIKTGQYKTVLVIGAEVLSKFVDWEDRATCILFGDGAGAVVLTVSDDSSGILSTHLFTDGSYADLLQIPAGGSRIPITHEVLDKRLNYITMSGNELFKVAVKALEEGVLKALEFNGLTKSDIDFLIPHQANSRIIKAMAKRLGLSMKKVVMNIKKYGNTSAASIPIALDEVNRKGKLKKDDLLILNAFGGGLTWGTALIKW